MDFVDETTVADELSREDFITDSAASKNTDRGRGDSEEVDEEGGKPLLKSAAECGAEAFADIKARECFLSKIYALYAAHLFAVFGVVMLTAENDAFQMQVASDPSFIWLTLLSPLGVMYAAYGLGNECRRRSPADFVLLGLMTIATGLSSGLLAAMTGLTWIALTLVFTAIPVTVLAFYFRTSKNCDASRVGSSALLSFSVLLICMAVVVFQVDPKPGFLRVVLMAGLSGWLSTLYVLLITLWMVSSDYPWELCKDEYPFATFNIYMEFWSFCDAIKRATLDSGEECVDEESGA